ncbi:hypothetical protein GCM10010112_75920 [Actinoplanes lobatus]|uniref:Major facilitator superfamily (MFS) profile domain-containing protein n=1 Tax=Actinoplanes lobatus TaxID=113568 RepID=A0A7W7MHI4_9ACTN|nr:hypothetical protein [Actinoplanes lobatus]MBB4750542.1 hypothetical protein [Actinoplanes lobatus]GGN90486.1 hypothetical protein GCM10010112_75920 [Actinoplanes lobatus]GIE43780.1 hypothetical protein Alo02nite_66780 [Actinoplanes lobatus]
MLLTWATNGLSFAERGRGTGLWTGTLFIGEFLSPVLITGLSGAFGGLRPALGVLGVATAVLAVATPAIVPRSAAPLNVTHDWPPAGLCGQGPRFASASFLVRVSLSRLAGAVPSGRRALAAHYSLCRARRA